MMEREDLRNLATDVVTDALGLQVPTNVTAELAQGVLDLLEEREHREFIFGKLVNVHVHLEGSKTYWRNSYKQKTNTSVA